MPDRCIVAVTPEALDLLKSQPPRHYGKDRQIAIPCWNPVELPCAYCGEPVHEVYAVGEFVCAACAA